MFIEYYFIDCKETNYCELKYILIQFNNWKFNAIYKIQSISFSNNFLQLKDIIIVKL